MPRETFKAALNKELKKKKPLAFVKHPLARAATKAWLLKDPKAYRRNKAKVYRLLAKHELAHLKDYGGKKFDQDRLQRSIEDNAPLTDFMNMPQLFNKYFTEKEKEKLRKFGLFVHG